MSSAPALHAVVTFTNMHKILQVKDTMVPLMDVMINGTDNDTPAARGLLKFCTDTSNLSKVADALAASATLGAVEATIWPMRAGSEDANLITSSTLTWKDYAFAGEAHEIVTLPSDFSQAVIDTDWVPPRPSVKLTGIATRPDPLTRSFSVAPTRRSPARAQLQAASMRCFLSAGKQWDEKAIPPEGHIVSVSGYLDQVKRGPGRDIISFEIEVEDIRTFVPPHTAIDPGPSHSSTPFVHDCSDYGDDDRHHVHHGVYHFRVQPQKWGMMYGDTLDRDLVNFSKTARRKFERKLDEHRRRVL